MADIASCHPIQSGRFVRRPLGSPVANRPGQSQQRFGERYSYRVYCVVGETRLLLSPEVGAVSAIISIVAYATSTDITTTTGEGETARLIVQLHSAACQDVSLNHQDKTELAAAIKSFLFDHMWTDQPACTRLQLPSSELRSSMQARVDDRKIDPDPSKVRRSRRRRAVSEVA
eukprot:scpid28819/ scgid15849/ 